MNYKTNNSNNGKNGHDEFCFRFKGVPVNQARKIIQQEKNYRKQQLSKKRRNKLFCADDVKRKQAIEEYNNNKQKLVEGLDYILHQAENYHKCRLNKGGNSNGNGSIVSMAAQKRAS
jgi:hypothetical protein